MKLQRRELRELAAKMKELGWRTSHCGSGHVRWDHPQVPKPVFTASTPKRRDMIIERGKLMTAMRRAGIAP